MAISIADGVQVQGGDHLADLLWETDPEIFRFIFRDLQVWRRLFPQEWTAAFGTQQADETRVALDGNRVVGLSTALPGPRLPPALPPRWIGSLPRWTRMPASS